MNRRALLAEGIGAFFLFACVIGSGIMADNLAQGNDAIALLGNTVATGAILFVLITMLGPISGAHFNPAVSLVAASRGELPWRVAAAYIAVQLAFGIFGRRFSYRSRRGPDLVNGLVKQSQHSA
jgi:glycerol uptake facilitator-like aquaporin